MIGPMGAPDRVIRSRRVVSSDGVGDGVGPAAIVISDGVIAEVAPYEFDRAHPELASLLVGSPEGRSEEPFHGQFHGRFHDLGNAVIMPGLVDTHVHVNEPGRTEWEGYATATRAAAAGGITTLIDMPLNSIPVTTSPGALVIKREAAAGQCFIDVGFWGGVVPGNDGVLRDLIDAGVMGFKCFLCDSGIPEFAMASEPVLRRALAVLGEAGVPLLAHAELPGPLERAAREVAARDPQQYATFLASRPPEAEEQAIALLAGLCRATGAAIHVVHHSAASAVAIVEAARRDELRLSAETCPHYLHFAAEDIPDGATEFKCAPPIRSRDNREALWRALADGALDMVVSDHSPCTAELKARERGDFLAAWGGVASLQLSLPVTWTGASRRGHGLAELARWMCGEPARLAGLEGRKGAIAAGCDGDLVVWHPESGAEIDVGTLEHKNKITPYHGETLHGVVAKTYLRGELIYDRGRYLGGPSGRLLSRLPNNR